MSIKLAYGLKEGKVVKVTDVANGLACDCICLDCKAKLIAVNNIYNQITPHFRHYSFIENRDIIACEASHETAIHYLAKDIIERNKVLTLPEYFIRGYVFQNQMDNFKFEYIENENKISTSQGYQDIRPDLIAYFKKRQLFIEVSVSNPTKYKKIERFRELNVSAIEIDLSKFPRTCNEEELEKFLQKEPPIKWLYHAKHEEFYQSFLEKTKNENLLKESRIADFIKREAEIKKERQKKFYNDFEKIILNDYKGSLHGRIEKFILFRYGDIMRYNYIYSLLNQVEELDDLSIDNSSNYYQIKCEFIGLNLNFSIASHLYNQITYHIISNIYHRTIKLLFNDLEEKVYNQEIKKSI